MARLNVAVLLSEDRSRPVHPFSRPESQANRSIETFHGGIAAVLPERV